MKIRVAIGLAISAVFVYLAFKDVDFDEMLHALVNANYRWLFPASVAMLLSHWFRALRWRFIMEPIKPVKVGSLFSALMIGYASNNIFPLRLGEFLRAYAIAKSQNISKTSAFATVVVDRLLDILSLLLVLAITVFLYPMPQNIKNWGYAVSVATVGLIVFMVFLMEKTDATVRLLEKIMPGRVFAIVQKVVRSFLQGFMVFKKSEHYLSILMLSLAVWFLYAVVVYLSFFAFNFTENYGVGLYESLVVLVIISIGLMIPASPGFVGTYHWFCMKSLSLFGIPESEALSFAVISHALNTIPFTIVGLLYFWKENLHLSDAVSEKEAVKQGAGPETLLDSPDA